MYLIGRQFYSWREKCKNNKYDNESEKLEMEKESNVIHEVNMILRTVIQRTPESARENHTENCGIGSADVDELCYHQRATK